MSLSLSFFFNSVGGSFLVRCEREKQGHTQPLWAQQTWICIITQQHNAKHQLFVWLIDSTLFQELLLPDVLTFVKKKNNNKILIITVVFLRMYPDQGLCYCRPLFGSRSGVFVSTCALPSSRLFFHTLVLSPVFEHPWIIPLKCAQGPLPSASEWSKNRQNANVQRQFQLYWRKKQDSVLGETWSANIRFHQAKRLLTRHWSHVCISW